MNFILNFSLYLKFIFYVLACHHLVDIYNSFIYRYIYVILHKVKIKGGKIYEYRGLSLEKSVFQIDEIRICL